MARPAGSISKKAQLFIKEYLVDLNAAAAGRRAGLSSTQAAHAMLKTPKVASEIRKEMARRSERTQITADMVLQELAKIGFSNIGDFVTRTEDGDAYVDLASLDHDQMAALSELSVDMVKGERRVRRTRVKVADKISALEKIGRHLGMFKEGNADIAGGAGVVNVQTINVISVPSGQFIPAPKTIEHEK